MILGNTDGSTTELNFNLFYKWLKKLISKEDNTTTIREIFEEVHPGVDMESYLRNVGKNVLVTDFFGLGERDGDEDESLFEFLESHEAE